MPGFTPFSEASLFNVPVWGCWWLLCVGWCSKTQVQCLKFMNLWYDGPTLAFVYATSTTKVLTPWTPFPSDHLGSATVLGIQCWYCHCLFIFLAQSLSGTRRYRRVESRENLQRKTGGPGQQAGRPSNRHCQHIFMLQLKTIYGRWTSSLDNEAE